MDIVLTLSLILQSFAISLGVGSSTLAIVNFFAAIKDGTIDATERRMMGIVYVVLRVAMVLILLSTISVTAYAAQSAGGLLSLNSFAYAVLLTLLMLFLNAMLMTAKLMPSTFGPAIQGGSWYTLGALFALQAVHFTTFSFTVFLLCYVTWLILAVSIVNGIMAWMNAHRHGFIK